jgi:hypothetical protein
MMIAVNFRTIHSNKNFHFLLLRLVYFLFTVVLSMDSFASSRMGTAVIRDLDGIPCFALPKNSETRSGIPLFTLLVTKRNAPDATTVPHNAWVFRVEPMGNSILLRPENCIRYGAVPEFAEQEMLEPLQAFRVYSVAIQAIPAGSNLRGYKAEFCVKPSNGGKLRVQVVQWDKAANEWRYDVCDKP